MADTYIDAHNHMQALSYDDWELLAMTGMAGALLSCGNPHVHRKVLAEVPGPGDVRRLWDSPIRVARIAEEQYGMRLRCGVGISSMTRVRGWRELVGFLPEYMEEPMVAAVGEVGLDPGQYFGFGWDLEDQARCLEAQAKVAAEADTPLILHTPTPKISKEYLGGVDTQGSVPPEAFRLHYLKRDLEILKPTGLPPERILIDHVDATIIDFVHRETDSWCAISIGSALRPISPRQIAEWVKRYGPERIVLNSDHVPYLSTDLLCIPRAVRAMRRAGIPEEDIRKVSFENANRIFGFGF